MSAVPAREPGSESTLRAAVIATARRFGATALSLGKTGNVSVRYGDGFLITPTGVAYDTLLPEMIVRVGMSGAVAQGSLAPSSEWRFHRDIYANQASTGAVVHVHSPHATALACAHRPIPAFHYMVAAAGGDSIPLAPYATFGTQALSDHVVAALADRRACLLANHGLVATGADLERAFDLALMVEEISRHYCLTLQVGEPQLLDHDEMQTVIRKFETYGRT
jgi:L-fuculose-phosphate aldolase